MIYALIVLYNKTILESTTFKHLKKYKDKIKINVFDNGKEEYIKVNRKYCEENDVNYYTIHKNIGISKAYNFVIDKIDKKEDDHILILDDDTILNDDYIEEIFFEANKKEYDVVLPTIISDKRIISPANVQFNCRIKILKSINELNIKKVSAINSGMLIKLSVFNKIRYNEEIFLDYVDHDFMKQVRENKFRVHIMKAKINQNYSRFQKNSIDSEIYRFKIYLKDFKIYCKECNNILFFYISVLKYKLRECIKYKSFKFLFLK